MKANLLQESRKLSRPYCIGTGAKFRLRDHDPRDTGSFTEEDRPRAAEALQAGVQLLAEMQDRLFAQDRYAVLIVIQAMDAAGKDSVIEHVMKGINPQGCEVHSFKQPSHEELDHDFMWRSARCLPERGRIGIFNRSYYEEVLVVRVHPEILAKEKMPDKLVTKDIWKERFKDIRAFERYLARNGTLILKFFLHVSKDEQKRRFLERIEEPSKNWKFAMGDVEERKLWDKYMDAYEDMIRHTSRPEAPWHVVPADNKWFTRLVVAAEVVEALDRLGLKYPKVAGAARRDLEKARQILRKER